MPYMHPHKKIHSEKVKQIALTTWWERQAYLGKASMLMKRPPFDKILECKANAVSLKMYLLSFYIFLHLCWGGFAYFEKVVDAPLEQWDAGACIGQELPTLLRDVQALLAVQDSVNVQEYHLHCLGSLKSGPVGDGMCFTIANLSTWGWCNFFSAALMYTLSSAVSL